MFRSLLGKVTEKQFCIVERERGSCEASGEGQIANDISNLFELKALRSVGEGK